MEIRMFQGPARTMTREQASRMVRGAVVFRKGEETILEEVIERFLAGDSVWHAVSVVTGKPCWCQDCRAGR